ncbi:MAG: hypothetical protein BWY71_00591 [Planctomycetes bacterium ADurb.Bin412]|nr:MAG: hypothetical protein BWY71_00591 [Planctomycetes bacterium ADurb.Bin412]
MAPKLHPALRGAERRHGAVLPGENITALMGGIAQGDQFFNDLIDNHGVGFAAGPAGGTDAVGGQVVRLAHQTHHLAKNTIRGIQIIPGITDIREVLLLLLDGAVEIHDGGGVCGGIAGPAQLQTGGKLVLHLEQIDRIGPHIVQQQIRLHQHGHPGYIGGPYRGRHIRTSQNVTENRIIIQFLAC